MGDSLRETVRARGHDNVAAEHNSTFEVTADGYLTPAGDCILGIGADRVPADFDSAFVAACQSHGARVVATVETAGHSERVVGRGHPDLTFESSRSLVCRTSEYVDDRTVMIRADAAAADLGRSLVAELSAGADLTLTLAVG
jgi:hypothetical protein